MILSDSQTRAKGWIVPLLSSLTAATLLLPTVVNSIVLGLLLATLLYARGPAAPLESIKKSRLIQSILVYYSALILYTLVFDRFRYTTLAAERNLPLLLLPVLYASYEIPHRVREVVFVSFNVSTCVTDAFLIFQTWQTVGLRLDNLAYFSWQMTLLSPIPSNYLALYTSFCAILSFHWTYHSGRQRYLALASLFITFLSLGLIGSRTHFVAALLLIIGIALWKAIQQKIRPSFLTLVILVLTATVTLISSRYLLNKVIAVVQHGSTADPRHYEFKATMALIKRHPMGLGFEQAQNLLIEEYSRIGFNEGVANAYNSHNQFLQTTLNMGFLGLGILLLVYILVTATALKSRDLIAISLAALLWAHSLTESLLFRNKGIVFFSFFMGLLITSKQKE
jgi:O-antigen ligase